MAPDTDQGSRKGAILLVGGCGFLGRSLADYLHAAGETVRIFDRPRNVERMRREAPWFTYHAGDLRELDATAATALRDVHSVVHLVHSTIPATSMDSVAGDAVDNIVASIRFMDVCRREGVQRFVFISSGGTVYGIPQTVPVSENAPLSPICAYGVSKLAVEKYVNLYTYSFGWEGIVVRIANPYGAYQLRGAPIGAIANFLPRTEAGDPLTVWGDGSVIRDYIYIDDVVRALHLLLVGTSVTAGTYNLGSGSGHSLRRVIELVGEVCGRMPRIKYLPERRIDVPEIVLDISKIRAELGWRPSTRLRDGIYRLWQAHKSSRSSLEMRG